MNQILENKKDKIYYKKIFIVQFIIYVVILIILFINTFYNMQKKHLEIASSHSTIKSYSIMKLYANSKQELVYRNNNKVMILGSINIPKINIEYPILSKYSEDLLKISVCKFYGPDINQNGNFCIVGHNYNTEVFFSNINSLELGDTIIISGKDDTKVKYEVYSKYEITKNDMTYLSQFTYREKRNYFNYL